MKIGRNDICPCGSGKKYKKCCLAKTKPSINYAEELNKIAEESFGDMIVKEKCDKCGEIMTIYEYQEGFGTEAGINKKLCLKCAEFLDFDVKNALFLGD
ncbi:MAG: SEC-C metal-binding domain-containing protein [bacterium]